MLSAPRPQADPSRPDRAQVAMNSVYWFIALRSETIRVARRRRGGRVVECTALEMRHTGNRIGGSNPSLSATLRPSGCGWHATRPEGRRVSPEAPQERRETGVWYVYFLRLNNGDTYVGSTNDLRRRFKSHQNGSVASTRQFLPAMLSSYVAIQDETVARKLEIYFKSGSGKAFAKKRFLMRRP